MISRIEEGIKKRSSQSVIHVGMREEHVGFARPAVIGGTPATFLSPYQDHEFLSRNR